MSTNNFSYENICIYEDKIHAKCKAIIKVLRTFGTEIEKVGQFSNVDNKQK